MVGCASESKTHMNIQSKEEAFYLNTKKLIISAQSNSCLLCITGELFLLAFLATRSFPCLLKTFFTFGDGCKFVWLVLGYDLPAVLAFISFYQLLPLPNTLPAFLGKLLHLRQIWLDAFTQFALSSNFFFFTKIFKPGKDLINCCWVTSIITWRRLAYFSQNRRTFALFLVVGHHTNRWA